MIDVKQAVRIAAEYFADILGSRAEASLLEEVSLEEEDGRRYWKITFSIPSRVPLAQLVAAKEYKVVTVDAESGEVRSIKIRQVNAA